MADRPAQTGALDGGAAILALFCADLVVRASYQIGKAPVLTVLALDLGAAPLLLGTIASVSTATGFLLKPVFGLLSDRGGRWLWLAIGTTLFAGVPLLYGLVRTPGDLVALRLVHGLATAIYGPVTLAYVAASGRAGPAEAFGWFGLARTAANVAGPLVGGAALALAEPQAIYAATGLLASLAFLAVMRLGEPPAARPGPREGALRALLANRPLLMIGVVEGTVHVAIYAVKGFAPVLMLVEGVHPVAVGTFLATQEAVAAAARPPMGRLSDRTRPALPMLLGMLLISGGLMSIAGAERGAPMLLAAALIGGGQGAFGPAALACVAETVPRAGHGLAYGAVGALRNAGKIAGPVAAGGLTAAFSAATAFLALALVPLIAAAPLIYLGRQDAGRART